MFAYLEPSFFSIWSNQIVFTDHCLHAAACLVFLVTHAEQRTRVDHCLTLSYFLFLLAWRSSRVRLSKPLRQIAVSASKLHCSFSQIGPGLRNGKTEHQSVPPCLLLLPFVASQRGFLSLPRFFVCLCLSVSTVEVYLCPFVSASALR